MGIGPVDLREIEKKTANIYEAIIISGKKARMINEEQKLEFNSLLETVPPTNTDEDGEDFDNPAQLKLSLEFERRPKPHLQAMNLLLEDEVQYEYKAKE
ncbi:MAG: DNA-directed RNA polymerase subunit omega [Ignavibacteriales bacterium]|jgi:hypothetical protein|nr:DNA-directed RNA polymerase subunit omega [Ignavibacteriaceae bacterium]NLH60781.1 DNA-directed RNA polymerase subunit omega [Ignavibacteriales bacterium]HOJ18047.1 DNA-directed RNA polymerase subunit omega [Ignavibacteriaceae bacterium]HPO56243.1 DNA-directed RNA polymerase subunit omega [Ignavibacteriaceae bacterium]